MQSFHLSNINFSGVHELEDGCEVGKGNVLSSSLKQFLLIICNLANLKDNYGMFCWVLLQQVLEVWRASAQDHLVGLGMLTLNTVQSMPNFTKVCLPQLRSSHHRSFSRLWGVWRRRPCWSGSRSSGGRIAGRRPWWLWLEGTLQ